jgi:putative transposase
LKPLGENGTYLQAVPLNETLIAPETSFLLDGQPLALGADWAPRANAAELCRRLGISRETLYNWKRKYGGMTVPDAKRLKQLEDENRQLKRIVADQALNVQVLKDLLGNKL